MAVLYGRHPVLESLKSGRTFEKIFIQQGHSVSEGLRSLRKLAESEAIPVLFAPREKLDRLAGNRDHQGVVGILSEHGYNELDDILQRSKGKTMLLVLDHLEDPQNLGSLLRTCDAVGVSGVVIPKRRAAGLSGGTAKASAGAIEHVPVARVTNLHQTLLRLRKEGLAIVGADQSAVKQYRELEYRPPLALVLGNEHKGLSLLLRHTCHDLIRIPMEGHLDSLNVSVAGALILYEIFFQWKRLEPAAN